MPSHEVFRARRARFLEQIGDGVAVLPAAPELYKSGDTEVPFRQDSDFFYLTGFPEPGAVAVLSPHDAEHRFTLFVRPRDPERESWSGPRAGVEGARDSFGADAAYALAELDQRLKGLLEPADRIWYALGRSPEMDRRIVHLLADFRRSRPRSGRGPRGVEDPDRVLGPMRMIKDTHEIACIRRAAEITAAGHCQAMGAAHPGAGEWEIEAALHFAFRSAGATGPAYPSIVASGPNGRVLHYTSNDRRAGAGDLVLLDAGAEYAMYCADITRTWPVSGRFTAPQRAVYELVLAAEQAGLAAVAPGASVAGIHDVAVRALTQGLVDLGLLTGDVSGLIESGAYKRFYMHQTSHWLGLDVHDAGIYRDAAGPVVLEPGMVLTVEPGLYIPQEDDVPQDFRGIAVRIEDNALVTRQGREILTRGVPVAPEEVEVLARAGGQE